MTYLKNLIMGLISTLLIGIASVFGMLAGFALWNNGLGEKLEQKARKLFKKE